MGLRYLDGDLIPLFSGTGLLTGTARFWVDHSPKRDVLTDISDLDGGLVAGVLVKQDGDIAPLDLRDAVALVADRLNSSCADSVFIG
jgi:hypothetical protein